MSRDFLDAEIEEAPELKNTFKNKAIRIYLTLILTGAISGGVEITNRIQERGRIPTSLQGIYSLITNTDLFDGEMIANAINNFGEP